MKSSLKFSNDINDIFFILYVNDTVFMKSIKLLNA